MARVFVLTVQLICLILPHFAASKPEVSAKIVRKHGTHRIERVVEEGQAAYVDWGTHTRISEVVIKCTWPGSEFYTGYEIHRRNNGSQRTLVHSGEPEVGDIGRYRMKKEFFLPGAYWCVGQKGVEGKTPSDDAVYLGEKPKLSLKQLQPFPANKGTARFVCEVEDGLTSIRIDRKLDYQYIDGHNDTHDVTSSTPGGEWLINATELMIFNADQDWTKSVRVFCRVKGLSVRDSAAEGDFDMRGYFYRSQPVSISFTETIPAPVAPVVIEPTHAAAVVIVGIVLLALLLFTLALLTVVLVRRRKRRTQPAGDTEPGVPGDPHHHELVQAPGEGCRRSASRDLSPTPRIPLPVPGYVLTPLPGACDWDRERHWTEGVLGCG